MEAFKEACPICLEGASTEPSVAQPCNHVFCLECITKWTEHNSSCPLCLKQVTVISRKNTMEEDSKEVVDVKVAPKSATKAPEEEFECLGHDYFVSEFRALFKKAKDAEFSLKSQIGSRKKMVNIEKNYQLAIHMKQEIEMKLNFLARTYKISPRDLLADIQHFSDLLRKINSSENVTYQDDYSYVEDAHYDEDYYGYYGDDGENDHYSMYTVAITKTAKNKKKNNKSKQKNKKEELDHDNATIMLS